MLTPAGKINADPNTTYFLFTAKNVGSCFNTSTCAFSYYCAYHSNVALGGTTVQYGTSRTRTPCRARATPATTRTGKH